MGDNSSVRDSAGTEKYKHLNNMRGKMQNSAHTDSNSRSKSNVSDQVKEKAQTIREDLAEVVESARDAASEKVEELRKSAAKQTKQVEKRIAREPLKSVLIAGGIGFVVGLIMRRS